MINPEILQFVTGICVSDVQIVPNPSCIRRILSCEPLRFRQFFHHAVFLPFDVLICGCDKTRRSGFPPARHVLRARRSDRNREFQCQERLHCVPCSVVHVPVMATRPCYITIDIGLRYAFYARITVFCAQIGKITQGRRRCRQREWEGLQTRRVTAGWKSDPIPRRTRHGENRARPPRDGFGIRHVAGPGHTAGSKTRVRATSPSPPPLPTPTPPRAQNRPQYSNAGLGSDRRLFFIVHDNGAAPSIDSRTRDTDPSHSGRTADRTGRVRHGC